MAGMLLLQTSLPRLRFIFDLQKQAKLGFSKQGSALYSKAAYIWRNTVYYIPKDYAEFYKLISQPIKHYLGKLNYYTKITIVKWDYFSVNLKLIIAEKKYASQMTVFAFLNIDKNIPVSSVPLKNFVYKINFCKNIVLIM